jgi:hypothetical protein
MGKTLFVSDFDDTLAQTDSKIFLTRKGKRIEMDPAAYAVYDEQPGDQFDFSEFTKLINPKPIHRFVKLLKQAIGRADKIAILTARGHTRPVAQFLKMHGITSGVSIAALDSADPEKKEHPVPDSPSTTPSTPTATKSASDTDSEIAKQATQLGLDYLGFGRYGKNKKVTHTSQNGRLVPKQKS